MRSTIRNFTLFAGLLLACLTVVPAAQAYHATPAAQRLVNAIFAASARVVAVHETRTGVYYCPASPVGFDFTPEGCGPRGQLNDEFDLSNGSLVRIFGQVSANGRPTLSFLTDATGDHLTANGLGCWAQSNVTHLAGMPAITFGPSERLRIIAHRRHVILLQGTERGFRELNYVDPQTDLIVREDQWIRDRRRTLHSIARYTVLTQVTTPPTPTPAC